MSTSRKRQKLSADGKFSNTSDTGAGLAEAPRTGDEQSKDSRTLYVRSLPPSTTTERLAEFFSEAALLKHAVAVLDKENKQCKGYGFVTFAEPHDAQQAKAALNGHLFEGSQIQIEVAEPRKRRSAIETRAAPKASLRQTEHTRAKERHTVLTSPIQGWKQDYSQAVPRLIIRNLPWSIKDPDQLSKLFMSYGKVKDVQLPRKPNGTLRGFGFVLLRGRNNAEKALNELNGRELDGRTLAVDWAAPKDIWEQRQHSTATNDKDDDATAEVQSSRDTSFDALSCNGSTSATREHPELGSDDDDSNNVDDRNNLEMSDVSFLSNSSASLRDEVPGDESRESTLFVRNLPFSIDDLALYEHFRTFGPIRYARVVMENSTGDEGRSRGTGFVCFYNLQDAQDCLKHAPRHKKISEVSEKDRTTVHHSLLEDLQNDPLGRYTLDGRLLQLSQCIPKSQARIMTMEGKARREKEDKRRLYLLREGNILSDSPLYKLLSLTEVRMREASAKQRQNLLQNNPSLHMSLTRLAVRNIPRFITSKDLKALARHAVVEFATEVKNGERQALSKEELSRTSEAMRDAERQRRSKGKGIVRQAKIVHESRDGTKVAEKSAAGRSRGYGFIEYTSHRCALMGLRWLNGHLVTPSLEGLEEGSNQKDTAKRLIVEFAIENAQVIQRRREREKTLRSTAEQQASGNENLGDYQKSSAAQRKYSGEGKDDQNKTTILSSKGSVRQKIIGRKRARRKANRSHL